MTWLSVITVVKDDPRGFERSLQSLKAQDLDGLELVVIDGSTDTTVIPAILGRGNLDIPVTATWRAPRGIYAAMNEGLDMCTGTFVYFLNAGDTFHSPEVLKSVRAQLNHGVLWAFGHVVIIDSQGRTTVTPYWDYERHQKRLFAQGFFPPHQGTFASAQVLRGVGGFDTGFRISADYAMFLKLSLVADPLVLPDVIADFHEGGTSTSGWQESFHEFHRARREIFEPRGIQAIRERWDYLSHFVRVYVYREIFQPLSSSSRPQNHGAGRSE